jgi:hypothetical protein
MRIQNFTSRLGAGVRPNKFRVICPFPTFAIIGGETNDLTILAKAAALPSSTLGVIEVPFHGRKAKLAGDRIDDPWSITVLNDPAMKLRNAFERWNNGIKTHVSNVGLTSLNDYSVDIQIQQLDLGDNVIKTYTLISAWPEKIGQIDLSMDSENAIEEFTVDFQFQALSSDTMS